MMYFKLMRVFLKENFSFRRLFGINFRKSKKKAIFLGIMLLYSLCVFLGMFGYMFFDLGKLFSELGVVEILLMYMFIYVFAISSIMVLLRANGYLFRYKDYEILEPLPIPHRTVFFAKSTVMMIVTYFSLIIFVLPIAFAYFYHAGFSVVGLLMFIVGFLFIPLISVVVFSLISMIIARLTSRFRKSNLLNIIFMLVVFIGVTMLFMSFNVSEDENPLLNQQGFIAGLGEIYLPMMWFVKAIHNHDIVSLILLIAINGIPFYLFLILVQPLSTKTNQKGLSVVTRKNNKAVKYRARTLFSTLVMKEIRKFFSVPIYAVNAGFGPLILVILGVLSVIYKTKIMEFMINAVGLGIAFPLIVAVVIGFSLSMVYTSSISLSLEGKNFWIIKSLPIQPELVMNAKIAFNVLLGLPFAYFALTMIAISFAFPFMDFLVLVFLFTAISLMVSAMDAFINLHFPKFEFMNDTEVVKQSMGSLIGVFGGMGILVLDGIGFYFLEKTLSWQLSLAVVSVFDMAVFGLFFTLVNKSAPKLFAKMAG